jgi:hypothetical protein
MREVLARHASARRVVYEILEIPKKMDGDERRVPSKFK